MLGPLTIRSAIDDPFVQAGALAIVGTVFTRAVLRRRPQKILLGHLVWLAMLTILLFYEGVVPYDTAPSGITTLQRLFIGLAKISWWSTAAWTLVGFVRVFVVVDGQPRERRLIQDLVVGLIYVGALLSVVAYVFNAPVGTLLATSGVLAVILGLALQSTLGDVFSGIALNIARPYGIGDRLVFADGNEGVVIETNWRATHLMNGANDLLVVPNSDLAKARLTNLSRPERSHCARIAVRFAPTTNPATIAGIMRTALMSSNTILSSPAPAAQVKSMDALAIELDLFFYVGDVAAVGSAQNEVFDLVFRHARASNLHLAPPPAGRLPEAPPWDGERKHDLRPTSLRLLDALSLFSSLTDAEREVLAESMTRRTYRKGDVIAQQGTTLQSLMIVRKGVVSITRREEDRVSELGRFAPGDCFGERGLLAGTGEAGTINALTAVVVYEIGQEGLGPLIRDRPAMADELAATLAHRAEHEKHLFSHESEAAEMRSIPRLVARMRQLFGIT